MYISKGNRKLKEKFLIWSLPSEVTCPGSTPLCRKRCYAKKAERLYRGVLRCRYRNLIDSLQEDFTEKMVDEIRKRKRRLFRIHEAGDFYNQEYLEKWFEIARQLPGVKFLAYTASFHLDFTGCPDNLQIIWSIWSDTDVTKVPPAGPRSFIGNSRYLDPARFDRAFLCPGKCANCLYCWYPKGDVRFKIH